MSNLFFIVGHIETTLLFVYLRSHCKKTEISIVGSKKKKKNYQQAYLWFLKVEWDAKLPAFSSSSVETATHASFKA